MNFCIVNNFKNINSSYFNNNNLIGINFICNYDYLYSDDKFNFYYHNDDYENIYFFNLFFIFIFIFNLFKNFLMFGFGLSFILVVVSRMYHNMVIDFEKKYTIDPSLYECDKFLFEYLDEYIQLEFVEINNSELKKLKNKFIKLNTSKGWVVMNYDNNNETFNYYSKKNNVITFDYLEVISRIYVIQYNCKSIYIDDTYNYSNHHEIDEVSVLDNSNSLADKNESNKNEINQLFYKKNNNNKSNNSIGNFVKNKYKYKGTIEYFNKLCKFHSYQIFDIHTNNIDNNILENHIDLSNTSFDNSDIKTYNLNFFSLKKLSKNLKLKNKILANDNSFNNINNEIIFSDNTILKKNKNLEDDYEYYDDNENEDSELSSFEDIDNCLNINFGSNKEKNISFKTFKNNIT